MLEHCTVEGVPCIVWRNDRDASDEGSSRKTLKEEVSQFVSTLVLVPLKY